MKHSTSKVLREQIEQQKNELLDEKDNLSLDKIFMPIQKAYPRG